jgi:hypothetical protein
MTLFRNSPAMVAVAIVIADSICFADPDLWGHIRFGQATLHAGHLILRDPYSYSAPQHLWLDHEWLAEVVMACAYEALGVFGLKLMKLALAALTVLGLAAAEGECGAPAALQTVILVATALAVSPWIEFRPQLFTFAGFAALLWLLARDAYRRAGGLWLAIPLLALWANLHGGFIAGIAALWIYALAAGATDIATGRGWRRAARLAAIAVAAALATLATPYGIGTWNAVGHALGNPYTRAVVDDWQPLLASVAREWNGDRLRAIFDLAPLALGAALATAYAATLRASPRDAVDDAGLVAIAAATVAAALAAVRNAPIAELAIAVPLAHHAGLAVWRAAPNAGAAQRRPSAANQLTFGALALLLLLTTGFFSARLGARERYPAGATAFMASRGLHGNVLNYFAWGEYLIWHAEPESKVFVDGRYDTVYPARVVRDYLAFNFGESAALLDRYPHDFVLIPPELDARRLMDARRDWMLIYRDDAAVLYARVGSSAAKLAGVPVTGAAPPTSFP